MVMTAIMIIIIKVIFRKQMINITDISFSLWLSYLSPLSEIAKSTQNNRMYILNIDPIQYVWGIAAILFTRIVVHLHLCSF